MKNRFGIKTLVCFLCMVLPCLNIQSQTETDYDGNIYPIVTIGNQVWMAENLRTTHYSDGSAIEDGRAFDFYPYEVAMAGSDTTKYFFYYNNDSIYADEYGCLYNWFAAVNGNISSNSNPGGIQGVCPAGWHIPSLTEWEELENYVGEENTHELLEGGSTGFNLQFGGYRVDMDNAFDGIDGVGAYISTEITPDPAYITLFAINSDIMEIIHWDHRKTAGYSVRCIKDINTTSLLKQKGKQNILVYPNPCKDYFYIKTNGSNIQNTHIYSAEGKLIGSMNAGEENKISVRDFDKGLYLVTITTDKDTFTCKLIIE